MNLQGIFKQHFFAIWDLSGVGVAGVWRSVPTPGTQIVKGHKTGLQNWFIFFKNNIIPSCF